LLQVQLATPLYPAPQLSTSLTLMPDARSSTALPLNLTLG